MKTTEADVTISLGDGFVKVVGEGLDGKQLRRFFRAALGAEPDQDGWIVPLRDADGNELVSRIARRLDREGYAVRGGDQEAGDTLTRELERTRSFARAKSASQFLLGLGTQPAEEEPDLPQRTELLKRLDEFGWNSEDRNLYPHQVSGLQHALTAINAANFSVPGAGKTATALSVAAAHLAVNTIDCVLVVGPLSSFRPWETEAAIAIPGKLSVRRVRGLDRDSRRDVWRGASPNDLLICSYATAANDQAEIERLCERLRVMLIVDESHRVKRFKGGTWAPALVRIARGARIRMILTGTPMPQSPLDLWTQFNILWPDEIATGTRNAFQARVNQSFTRVIEDFAPFFTRTPKSELGLSPPRVFPITVEMASTQAEVYRLIEDRLRSKIPDAASWQEKLDALRKARPIRLIQAASNPDLLNARDGFFEVDPIENPTGTLMERLDRYRALGERPAKFEWALEKLKELQQAGEKCVVWTNFIRNIDQFSALIKDELGVPVFAVDGRVPAADSSPFQEEQEELDETREALIDAFLDTEGAAVLVANPAACAESISLHSACHTAIYLDRTHDCARWLQSIDRVHRLGLAPGTTVSIYVPEVVIDGRPTIDGIVDGALQRKSANMQSLLEGAELRGAQLSGMDSLEEAEGDDADLAEILKYLLGEA